MGKDQLDFSHFEKGFDNQYDIVAPEFGDLHQKRAEFIAKNQGTYRPVPYVPENIKGLIPLKTRLPATRNWYRRTSSFERNGYFNIHTPVFNTKMVPWTLFIVITWGWSSFQIGGYNYERFEDNGERRNTLYWKLAPVEVPQSKLWNRPS